MVDIRPIFVLAHCDRRDIQYLATEAPRWMASPCRDDYEKVFRIETGGCRRLVQVFPFGEDDEDMEVHQRRSLVNIGCMVKHGL